MKTRDGFVMEAMMIKPPDFDPSRRYPVYQFTYGGPHAQQVRNAWGGSQYMYHQLLAQKGIIVWICDNRTASGKGSESVWPLYKNFGETELRDIEDGVSWLKQQPYVDASRIGIHGWSYGGYMTSYALTHSKSFVMGIAGGTVADWRDYDTVYTERYMGLPEENPDGYRKSSPRFAAGDLQRIADADPRHDRRQRPPGQHDAVRLRAAEGAEAVPVDALPEVAPRRHRSAARQAPAVDDAEFRARAPETRRKRLRP